MDENLVKSLEALIDETLGEIQELKKSRFDATEVHLEGPGDSLNSKNAGPEKSVNGGLGKDEDDMDKDEEKKHRMHKDDEEKKHRMHKDDEDMDKDEDDMSKDEDEDCAKDEDDVKKAINAEANKKHLIYKDEEVSKDEDDDEDEEDEDEDEDEKAKKRKMKKAINAEANKKHLIYKDEDEDCAKDEDEKVKKDEDKKKMKKDESSKAYPVKLKKSADQFEDLMKSYIDERVNPLEQKLGAILDAVTKLSDSPVPSRGYTSRMVPLSKSSTEAEVLSKGDVSSKLWELKKSGTPVDSVDIVKAEMGSDLQGLVGKYNLK